jgi:transposase
MLSGMGAFSKDLREKILEALEADSSSLRVAERFGVSASFVRKLRMQVRVEGHYDALYRGGRERIVEPDHEDTIRAALAERPGATLNDLRRDLKKQTKLSVSESTMSRTLRRLGITRKKKTVEASERDDPKVKAKRRSFLRRCKAWNVNKLVFIDETGITLSMTSRYAWSEAGERAVDRAPFRRGGSATLVAALTLTGVEAPFLFPGAMDGTALRTYVSEVLVPCLPRRSIVIWDNLAVHGDPAVRDALKVKDITIEFLPPYSPDLNPIELAWSKLKNYLRHVAERDWSRLTRAVRTSLRDIAPSACAGWFRHCGYPV